MKINNQYNTLPLIKRHGKNPILTAEQVPYQATLLFNPGVAKYKDGYVMVFRNDYGEFDGEIFAGTNLGLAFSENGIDWEVMPDPCFSLKNDEITRIYDPRITHIDDLFYLSFAVDTLHGIRGGIAVTEDFKNFEVLSMSVPDNRNMVLFPEKINNKYVRLERPFPVYGKKEKEAFDIWISESPDMVHWGNSSLLLGSDEVPYCNSKIGPAAPPIKTEKGWVTTFHLVDYDSSRGKNGWEDNWKKRYNVGLMLLDLEDPSKIISILDKPLMVPEVDYEIKNGFRNNVIFPCGMILEENGEVKIYYGAADTVIALATADLNDLLELLI